MTFQMSFLGWVLRVSSQARTAISLAPSRSSTSTSSDQKHQHQYLPYLLGFSLWSTLHTCHVSPPSIVTSTRFSFFPPPPFYKTFHQSRQSLSCSGIHSMACYMQHSRLVGKLCLCSKPYGELTRITLRILYVPSSDFYYY